MVIPFVVDATLIAKSEYRDFLFGVGIMLDAGRWILDLEVALCGWLN